MVKCLESCYQAGVWELGGVSGEAGDGSQPLGASELLGCGGQKADEGASGGPGGAMPDSMSRRLPPTPSTLGSGPLAPQPPSKHLPCHQLLFSTYYIFGTGVTGQLRLTKSCPGVCGVFMGAYNHFCCDRKPTQTDLNNTGTPLAQALTSGVA